MGRRKKNLLDQMFFADGPAVFTSLSKSMAESKKRAARERAKETKDLERRKKEADKASALAKREQAREFKAWERQKEEADKASALATNKEISEAFEEYVAGLDSLHKIEGNLNEWKNRFDADMRKKPFDEIEYESEHKPELEDEYKSKEEYVKYNKYAFDRIERAKIEHKKKYGGFFSNITRSLSTSAAEKEQEELNIIEQKQKALWQAYDDEVKRYHNARATYPEKLLKAKEEHDIEENSRVLFLNNCKEYNYEALDAYASSVLENIHEHIVYVLGYDKKYLGNIYAESPVSHLVEYSIIGNEVYLRVSAPPKEIIPQNSFSVSAARGNLQTAKIPEKKIDALYKRFLYSFSLMYCLKFIEMFPYFSNAYIDLYDDFFDKSTGKKLQNVRINLKVDSNKCNSIDFMQTDAVAVYNNFSHKVFFDDEKSKLSFQVPKPPAVKEKMADEKPTPRPKERQDSEAPAAKKAKQETKQTAAKAAGQKKQQPPAADVKKAIDQEKKSTRKAKTAKEAKPEKKAAKTTKAAPKEKRASKAAAPLKENKAAKGAVQEKQAAKKAKRTRKSKQPR